MQTYAVWSGDWYRLDGGVLYHPPDITFVQRVKAEPARVFYALPRGRVPAGTWCVLASGWGALDWTRAWSVVSRVPLSDVDIQVTRPDGSVFYTPRAAVWHLLWLMTGGAEAPPPSSTALFRSQLHDSGWHVESRTVGQTRGLVEQLLR